MRNDIIIMMTIYCLQAFAQTIREEISKFPVEDQDDVVVLFSAHSLPMKVCGHSTCVRLKGSQYILCGLYFKLTN